MLVIPSTLGQVKPSPHKPYYLPLSAVCLGCSVPLLTLPVYARSGPVAGHCLKCSNVLTVPYSARPRDLRGLKPSSILAPDIVPAGDEFGGIFEYTDPNRCTRCVRAFDLMPVSLRTSHLKGVCFNCYCKITRNGGPGSLGASVRAEGAAARPGLVTNAINGENTLELGNKPIVKAAIIVHRRDVKIRRTFVHATARVRTRINTMSTRQAITELSDKALRRMVYTARNMSDVTHIVTLTYPKDFPTDGLIVKKHLERFRKWLTYRGIGGFWFLEFQKRGAPHFHLFINSSVDHRVLRRYWFNLVKSGDIKHYAAGTQVQLMHEQHAAAAYAAKYAAKAEQKEVPEDYKNVGRFWGVFGGVQIEEKFQVNGDLPASGAEKVDTDPLKVPIKERLQAHKEGKRVPVTIQTQLDLASALRVVSRLYADDRKAMIAAGKRVRPAYLGYGTKSFTAFDQAATVSRVLPRLGLSIKTAAA